MKGISKLQDGNKGVVFKIINDDGKEEVIKLQGEPAAKAILGTEMMQKAGVDAPNISSVKDEGLKDFHEEVKAFMKKAEEEGNTEALATARQLSEGLEKAGNPSSRYQFSNVVRMDFASGQTLDQARVNKEKFKAMLTNPQFHKQLGKVMAGDAFAGNGDRFAARIEQGVKLTEEGRQKEKMGEKLEGAQALTGWYNKDNLIVEGEGENLKLKAIDNEFQPGSNTLMNNVFGHGAAWGQYGSIAAASPAQFKREIFAVAQLLEEQGGVQLSPEELQAFIQNTTESATETMGVMLKTDYNAENVGQKLKENGENEKEVKRLAGNFTEHREAIELLSGKMDKEVKVKPTVAQTLGIAKQKGPLTAEKVLKGIGLPSDVAKEIAGEREKLDDFNKLSGMEVERFKKLVNGERGDHVGKDFKLTVKEAALIARDESVYKQFTHKAGTGKKL